MKRWTATLLSLFVVILAVPAAGAQKAREEIEHLPGYVDFTGLRFFEEEDLAIEVNLHGSLLGILSQSLREEDREFSELLAKLRSVRVNVFKLDADEASAVRDETRNITRALVKEGWQAVVRIRGEEESIQILLREVEGRIAGLVAMFVDDAESVGFINIVGEVDPGQVARLGRALDIDVLEAMDQTTGEEGASDLP
jgi:hypothetical protein